MFNKVIIPHRISMPEQPADLRVHNFQEVTLGYSTEMAIEEARRCLECNNAGCTLGCPVNVDIPAFLKMVADGDFQSAVDLIKEVNPLPAITGRVCPQEVQCEEGCILCKKYEPVAIGRLERFLADWEAEHGFRTATQKIPMTGKKVAVVGSGPAGLTVAADLARLGHKVTIFEALHESGGVLVYGIPEFRLPKSIVRREVEYVCSLGVEILHDYIVGSTSTLDELLKKYDAVFLGTGAGLPWFMGIPGEDIAGVYSSNEYLTRSNLMKAYRFPDYDTPISIGRHVVTIGGGNTAMDAARTALRLGAEESSIVYRRSRAEMPARAEEIHHSEQEGVKFHFLTTPVAFIGEKDKLSGLNCIQNELGEPDASGRRKAVPIEGSSYHITADVAIIAIGQSPSPLISKTTPDLLTTKDGIVVVDRSNMKTSKVGVFAGGDIVTGGATVIKAMGQAKIAASAIHQYMETGQW